MSNVLVKIAVLKPYVYTDSVIEALIYKLEDLNWSSQTLQPGLSIESIYTEAHNTLMKTIQEINLSDGYLLVEIEGIGLRAFRLEGETKGVFRILYPMPQPLNKIIIYKSSNEGVTKIHEAVFSSEHWVYDGYVNVKDPNWDLLVIETGMYRKVISRREYETPVVSIKSEVRKRKKRKRRKKEKKGKTKKKKKKKRSVKRRRVA